MAGKLTSQRARELSAKRKNHRGGAPTKLVLIARQKFIEDKKAEAERSFGVTVAIQDNPFVNPDTRLRAALAIQDRVNGKPKEEIEHSGGISLTLNVKRDRSPVNSTPDTAAPTTAENQGQPS